MHTVTQIARLAKLIKNMERKPKLQIPLAPDRAINPDLHPVPTATETVAVAVPLESVS